MDVGLILTLHHSSRVWATATLNQTVDPGYVGSDPELTEKGQGLEQKWGKPADFFAFLSAEPRSDWLDWVAVTPKKSLNTMATLSQQVNWVKYGVH